MREAHWHPATVELGYVHRGRARMTVLDPDGSFDTYELQAGDAYFVPANYPHQIENVGDEDIHFCIFFDQPTPGDIGFKASVTHLRPELAAASIGIAPERIASLPYTASDPLIVPRVNPVDPVR
jgi:oxalate decarboxylase